MARSKFNLNFDDVIDEKKIEPAKKEAELEEVKPSADDAAVDTEDNNSAEETSKKTSKEKSKPAKPSKTKNEKIAPSSYTKTCINIDSEKAELVRIAAMMGYKGNVSAYINALIDKDIKSNGESYRQIQNLMN